MRKAFGDGGFSYFVRSTDHRNRAVAKFNLTSGLCVAVGENPAFLFPLVTFKIATMCTQQEFSILSQDVYQNVFDTSNVENNLTTN